MDLDQEFISYNIFNKKSTSILKSFSAIVSAFRKNQNIKKSDFWEATLDSYNL